MNKYIRILILIVFLIFAMLYPESIGRFLILVYSIFMIRLTFENKEVGKDESTRTIKKQ